MSRSQRPRKGNTTPVGKTKTLHSFFGSTTQSTPAHTSPQPAEIIFIDSDDENTETSPTQSKRKALNDPDPESFSSDSKRGKLFRSVVKFPAENESPLKSVPPSSLNRTITTAELYTQTNRNQQTMNLVSDWETGDDEFLDPVDDSQVVWDEDSPENILSTCPVCGAIFVDFCLSVSITLRTATDGSVFIAPLFSNCKRTSMPVSTVAYR